MHDLVVFSAKDLPEARFGGVRRHKVARSITLTALVFRVDDAWLLQGVRLEGHQNRQREVAMDLTNKTSSAIPSPLGTKWGLMQGGKEKYSQSGPTSSMGVTTLWVCVNVGRNRETYWAAQHCGYRTQS